MSNEALLFGWARRIEYAPDGSVLRFELQQTRNLNHCIPVEVPHGAVMPVAALSPHAEARVAPTTATKTKPAKTKSAKAAATTGAAVAATTLIDRAPVAVKGMVSGATPVVGDLYLPPVVLTAAAVCLVPLMEADFTLMLGEEGDPPSGPHVSGPYVSEPYSYMPSQDVFMLAPPPEAVTDDFVPPLEQFGDDEERPSNRVEVCGYLEHARLTDGVNDYRRHDSLEVLLRLAPEPVPPVQVRLYGRHAQTYSKHTCAGLPLKVSGALRVRTKVDPAGSNGNLRRMLYIHCAHLKVAMLEELPYLPDWLQSRMDAAKVA